MGWGLREPCEVAPWPGSRGGGQRGPARRLRGGAAGGELSLAGRALGNAGCAARRRGSLSPPLAVPVRASQGCQTNVAQTGWSPETRATPSPFWRLTVGNPGARPPGSRRVPAASAFVGLQQRRSSLCLASHGRLVSVWHRAVFVLCASASATLFFL